MLGNGPKVPSWMRIRTAGGTKLRHPAAYCSPAVPNRKGPPAIKCLRPVVVRDCGAVRAGQIAAVSRDGGHWHPASDTSVPRKLDARYGNTRYRSTGTGIQGWRLPHLARRLPTWHPPLPPQQLLHRVPGAPCPFALLMGFLRPQPRLSVMPVIPTAVTPRETLAGGLV